MHLEHPAGFTVSDAPCDAEDPSGGFHRECLSFGLLPERLRSLVNEGDSAVASPLDRWVNWLVSYIECRLALSINEPDRSIVRDLVFRHDAQIYVTAERVTVRFSLATHPIALRMAGLDRNPGWVPSAGRSISFEYE